MLKMGCSKADITPGFPCFLRGYASRTELTEQVEDPIEVGVIALEQDSTRQIILTVDSLATAEADCQFIRREIEQRFDIAPQNVVIACSHSHFAPEMCGFTISTGGGMPLACGEVLRRAGFVVFLNPPEEFIARNAGNGEGRPLFRENWQARLHDRMPAYRACANAELTAVGSAAQRARMVAELV